MTYNIFKLFKFMRFVHIQDKLKKYFQIFILCLQTCENYKNIKYKPYCMMLC